MNAGLKHRVSNDACGCGGPQAIARFGTNLTSDDQSHICQWGAQPYLVGPLSRLVGKPPFPPWLSKNVLPLTKAANGPNSAISLTQTFDRILFCVCNSLYFGVQKAKNGDRGTIVFTATLRLHYTRLFPDPRFLLFVLQNIAGYKNAVKCLLQ